MKFSRLSRRATLTGLASTAALPTLAASADLQRVAADIRAAVGAPGVTVATGQGDDFRLSHAGNIRVGSETPVGNGHLWHVGSITKSMTATLAARLAATGKLRLSDTVAQHLTGIIPFDEDYGDVTLRALLDHRSGLPANIDLDTARSLVGTLDTRPDIRADRVAYLTNAAAQAPDPQIDYSNAGYVMAGLICETVTGETWEALMQAHVFDPLGLTSAGFGAPGLTAPQDQPWGHRIGLLGRHRPVAPGPEADNVPALGPAGTVHLSATDLIRYLDTHARRDADFLPPQFWEALHEPVTRADYACGWGVNGTIRQHNGSNTMWYAVAGFDRDSGRTAAILTNSGAYRRLSQPGQDALMTLLQTR